MKQSQRRLELKNFAATQFKKTNNNCQMLVDIFAKAVGLFRNEPLWTPKRDVMAPPNTKLSSFRDTTLLVDDLEAVLIGESMREGRGKGPHFVGNIRGANGFRDELKDDYNQIQHATAGFVIGYRYGKVGEWGARWLEEEEQDDLLYEATCPVGRWLKYNPNSYLQLPDRMRDAIGVNTCKRAMPILMMSSKDLRNASPTPSFWNAITTRPPINR